MPNCSANVFFPNPLNKCFRVALYKYLFACVPGDLLSKILQSQKLFPVCLQIASGDYRLHLMKLAWNILCSPLTTLTPLQKKGFCVQIGRQSCCPQNHMPGFATESELGDILQGSLIIASMKKKSCTKSVYSFHLVCCKSVSPSFFPTTYEELSLHYFGSVQGTLLSCTKQSSLNQFPDVISQQIEAVP